MKPILFSTPMVKSILDGRKSQTRRVMKPHPPNYIDFFERRLIGFKGYMSPGEPCDYDIIIPKYKVGDILWVRETWSTERKYPNAIESPNKDIKNYIYKADKQIHVADLMKWKPSIFMPREACRIFLEVTDIRVERLQDISEQDAIAEGLQDYYGKNAPYHANKVRYIDLWDEINGKKYPWDSNPWVWKITFKRIEKP